LEAKGGEKFTQITQIAPMARLIGLQNLLLHGSIPKMGLIKAAEFQWMAKNPGKIRVP
jgi:hypothetical protein